MGMHYTKDENLWAALEPKVIHDQGECHYDDYGERRI
jgi:hypothetical protein